MDTIYCDGCDNEFGVSELITCSECYMVLCKECFQTHVCEPEDDLAFEEEPEEDEE